MVSEWNGHLEFFSRPQAIENCVGNIRFSEQIIYRKQSLNAPELGSKKKKSSWWILTEPHAHMKRLSSSQNSNM